MTQATKKDMISNTNGRKITEEVGKGRKQLRTTLHVTRTWVLGLRIRRKIKLVAEDCSRRGKRVQIGYQKAFADGKQWK